jgi:hypothetical protein
MYVLHLHLETTSHMHKKTNTHTHTHTHTQPLLTPGKSMGVLQKLRIAQLVEIFHALMKTKR